MAVASAEAADWQIGRDSTVAERLDHATDGESVVQNNGAVTGRSRERRRARGLIATTRSAINGSRVADLTQSIHGMDAHRATPRRTRTSGTANCVEIV